MWLKPNTPSELFRDAVYDAPRIAEHDASRDAAREASWDAARDASRNACPVTHPV